MLNHAHEGSNKKSPKFSALLEVSIIHQYVMSCHSFYLKKESIGKELEFRSTINFKKDFKGDWYKKLKKPKRNFIAKPIAMPSVAK